MAGAAPDPDDDPNEFFKDTNGKRGMLQYGTSFDEASLEGDEKKFAQETETVFGTFLFTRLISDIERDSEDGSLDLAEIPPPVISSIREDKDNIEFDPENDPKIIELGRMLASVGDEVHNFPLYFYFISTFQHIVSFPPI